MGQKKRKKKTFECKNKKVQKSILVTDNQYQLSRTFERGGLWKGSVCHSVLSSLLHWTFSFILKLLKTDTDWTEGKKKTENNDTLT